MKYTAIGVVEFPAGSVLGLTERQAMKRMNHLRPMGEGVFKVLRAVQFKAGEVLDLESRPKSMDTLLRAEGEPEKAPEPVARGRRVASKGIR